MAEKYIVANWKMNQSLSEIETFFKEITPLSKHPNPCHKWIAPQSIHYTLVKELAGVLDLVKVGAQNCHFEEKGAFTGEISPKALTEMGSHFTIIGHSERRTIFQEGHELLSKKAKTVLDCGMKLIFCIGETLEQRENNQTFSILKEQLDLGLKSCLDSAYKSNIIIAYEPVWAIGTGVAASGDQAQEAHEFIYNWLVENIISDTPILYGGSVKPSNIEDLLARPHIDGGLIGGAGLVGKDYAAMCEMAARLT